MFTFTHTKIPRLTILGAQITCAQNRYTAVQTDLKYPVAEPEEKLTQSKLLSKRLLFYYDNNYRFFYTRHNTLTLKFHLFASDQGQSLIRLG